MARTRDCTCMQPYDEPAWLWLVPIPQAMTGPYHADGSWAGVLHTFHYCTAAGGRWAGAFPPGGLPVLQRVCGRRPVRGSRRALPKVLCLHRRGAVTARWEDGRGAKQTEVAGRGSECRVGGRRPEGKGGGIGLRTRRMREVCVGSPCTSSSLLFRACPPTLTSSYPWLFPFCRRWSPHPVSPAGVCECEGGGG